MNIEEAERCWLQEDRVLLEQARIASELKAIRQSVDAQVVFYSDPSGKRPSSGDTRVADAWQEDARSRNGLIEAEAQLAACKQSLTAARVALLDYAARAADAESARHILRQQLMQANQAGDAGALMAEVNALRGRLQDAEATLARFRASVSWRITRPVRWTGRTVKKLIGRPKG